MFLAPHRRYYLSNIRRRQRIRVLTSGLILVSLAAVGGRTDALLSASASASTSAASSFSPLFSTASSSSSRRTMCLFSSNSKKDDSGGTETKDASSSSPAATNSDDDDKNTKIKALTWNPLRLGVLRLGLTEPAMTSPLNYGSYDGTFTCAYCGAELFQSAAKYDSGTGWPSFWRTAREGAVAYQRDLTGLECHCARCDSHLGHVFLDGPGSASVPPNLLRESPASDPRGRTETSPLPRYCINGASLNYRERGTATTNSGSAEDA